MLRRLTYILLLLPLKITAYNVSYQVPPYDEIPIMQGHDQRDLEIVREINDRLYDDHETAPYADQIRVESYHGVVTLYGRINSQRVKLLIEKKAKGVTGVRHIYTKISVDATNYYQGAPSTYQY